MEPRRLNRRGLIYQTRDKHQTRETGMINHAPTDWIMMKKTGQALLELAIFGSLFLMLLAILINYGLRYNYQQQLTQSAFRNALSSAMESMDQDKPSAVTYVAIQDKHIPDPSNPFGIGSVIPLSASASVTRSYQMQHTPDNDKELPVLKINISGKELGPYTTAGFSIEENIYPFMPNKDDDQTDVISKYEHIYGSNIEVCKNAACSEVKKLPGKDEYYYYDGLEADYNGFIDCLGVVKTETSDGMFSYRICDGQAYVVQKARWLDQCAGQIMDYDSAVEQCRKIIDKEVCRRECERNKSPYREMNCNELCGYSMNVPEYCETKECGTGECTEEKANQAEHKYTFTKLNTIFAKAGAGRRMGLSQDTTKTTELNTTLEKQEQNGKISVIGQIKKWKETIERKFIHYDKTSEETKEESVPTVVENGIVK